MENGVLFFLFYCAGYWVIKDKQDIIRTKLQISVIIKKRVEDF